MPKPVLEIDGRNVVSLESFYDEVERVLIPGASWGRNLDAFNDILRGGFGTPEGGFVLRWTHSDRSRKALGYPETVRCLEIRAQRCHPTNIPFVRAEIEAARRGEGPTMFDVLLDIISTHGEGGGEAEDGVVLELA
jgi:RNAse (barnase) inhibitor barstar